MATFRRAFGWLTLAAFVGLIVLRADAVARLAGAAVDVVAGALRVGRDAARG